MKIAIVIPNWNGADFLANALQSLELQTHKVKIVVVDNASSDDSVSIIKQKFPSVTLIENQKNLGFAGGVNTGIRYAFDESFEAIALFNNDAVADENWAKKLVEQLTEKSSAGIVTGKLMRDNKKNFDSTGDFYSTRGIAFPRGRNTIDKGQYNKAEEVFGASGGASLYRSSMLKDIGLFDERFFAYFEDVDISYRAQLAGWKVLYEPGAVAYHHVGATSSKLGDFTRYHSIKNFLMLYIKNMPGPLFFRYFHLFAYQFIRTTARSILDFKLHVWIKAVAYVLLHTPAILKDRWHIQRRRKASIKDVDRLLYKSKPPVIPEL